MHICIISEGYPYLSHAYFTFVKQICVALADNGWNVSVIAPISIFKVLSGVEYQKPPKFRREKTPKGNTIDIYAPRIFTVGNLCKYKSLYHVMMDIRQKAICKVISKMSKRPDVLYGHFWHSAFAAFPSSIKFNIPLFVATGESEIKLHKYYNNKDLERFSKSILGVICVSSKNKHESIDNNLTSKEKCAVIPNAIDNSIFYKKSKTELREQFGFKQDDFILAFVGSFIYRKGTKRIADAITMTNDHRVKSIFIGSLPTKDTTELPNCDGILFRGSLPHDKIPDYLNCSDVFVMPTLNEGCCNANIEALACGLPVISSDREFNYDILDKECAILIDPLNIEEISNAILYLKNHPGVMKKMSLAALEKAKNLEINNRAAKIMNFITDKIESR